MAAMATTRSATSWKISTCPPVKGENGYNTRSKSLAFFSYFYGALSLAVNG